MKPRSLILFCWHYDLYSINGYCSRSLMKQAAPWRHIIKQSRWISNYLFFFFFQSYNMLVTASCIMILAGLLLNSLFNFSLYRLFAALVIRLPQPASCCKTSSISRQLNVTTASLYCSFDLDSSPLLSFYFWTLSISFLVNFEMYTHYTAGIHVLPPTSCLHFLPSRSNCWKPGAFRSLPDSFLHVWLCLLDVRLLFSVFFLLIFFLGALMHYLHSFICYAGSVHVCRHNIRSKWIREMENSGRSLWQSLQYSRCHVSTSPSRRQLVIRLSRHTDNPTDIHPRRRPRFKAILRPDIPSLVPIRLLVPIPLLVTIPSRGCLSIKSLRCGFPGNCKILVNIYAL